MEFRFNEKEQAFRGAKLYPHRIAIVDGEKKLTFSDFNERVNRLANAILNLEVKKGEKIGVLLKNCSEYLEIYGACAKSGTVIVPLNFRFVARELTDLFNDSECTVLFLSNDYVDLIASMKPSLEFVKKYICIGEKGKGGMLDYEALLQKASSLEPNVPIFEEDPGAIMYSSGTTGHPKGALLTQKALMVRSIKTAIEAQASPTDHYLSVLPYFHIASQINTGFLHMGARTTIMKDVDPKLLCELIGLGKITVTLLAPTIINMIVQMPNVDQYDFGSLERILYGASPISQATLTKALNKFKCKFIQWYGGTETYGVIFLRPEDHEFDVSRVAPRRLSAAGRPGLLDEVKVVLEDGQEVKPGEVGEIISRSESNLVRYWHQEEETKKSIEDGWFHTGDMATVDKEGYIYVVDRLKDMVICGGENIYPREIEDVLHTHPDIYMAVVIGVPDEKWGESVKAVVVLKPGAKLTEVEVIDFCKENLASYKKPRSVDFIEITSMPINAVGKVSKVDLRERYWKGFERKVH